MNESLSSSWPRSGEVEAEDSESETREMRCPRRLRETMVEDKGDGMSDGCRTMPANSGKVVGMRVDLEVR